MRTRHCDVPRAAGARATAFAPGFSLIEVLISIVVLALGLLGIAAVFPAVVTQQRATTDAIQGGSLERSVQEHIKSNWLLNRSSGAPNANGAIAVADLRGWQILLANDAWLEPLNLQFADYPRADSDFMIPGSNTSQPGLSVDESNGTVWMLNSAGTMPSGTPLNDPVAWIPVSERQLPKGPNALYVWDFAVRRIGVGAPFYNSLPADPWAHSLQDDAIEIAVFIRRKDTPRNPATALPVAMDTAGRPTFDGTGVYSRIRTIGYSFPAADLAASPPRTDRLELDTAETVMSRYVSQIGQKLVDQWGVVHTVTEVDTSVTPNRLVVSPPVSYADVSIHPVELKMVYTPQVPVAVSVFTIRPRPIPGT